MRENLGKTRFDTIEIPEELSAAVGRGLRRGRRVRGFRCALSGMAATVALVFFAANIPPLYARAAEVPVLAPLVRVMRVGTGGETVDGAVGHVQGGRDQVRIFFTDREGRDVPVPVFSAAQRELPRRVTLRLHGMEETAPFQLAEALMEQAAVEAAYPLWATDPAEQGVTMHLAPGWDCTVGQGEQGLVLQFTQETPREKTEGYVLCSETFPPGEKLAEQTEALLWEGATQVRTAPGAYRVFLGEYQNEEQAQAAQQGILETKGVRLEILHITETP